MFGGGGVEKIMSTEGLLGPMSGGVIYTLLWHFLRLRENRVWDCTAGIDTGSSIYEMQNRCAPGVMVSMRNNYYIICKRKGPIP